MIRRNIPSGFTIVELLIVIVVIGILAAITIVAFNGVSKKAHIAVIQSDLSNSSTQLEKYKLTLSTSEQYPADLSSADLKASPGTTYQYTYTASTNSYCLTASNNGIDYNVSSSNNVPTSGVCPGHTSSSGGLPAGYETAPLASGGSTSFDGYKAVEPSSCPTHGGSWIKVPGNSLYNKANGFCVQQYPAVNVSGVATSQNTGNKWTVITQPDAMTAASAVDTNTHLFTEDEWMTIATNAAAQPANWSGGSVGNGTLPTGSSTATHGGTSVVLSNGQTIYFDTGSGSYYASNEWTCYTGPSADNCGLAATHQPIPANAYYTDQFGTFTSYGTLATNGSGYYYGDPRYANSALGPYINASRNSGLGYLRSSYISGSGTIYAFSRGTWTGAQSSGLFTLYIFTTQTYEHATYGFRVAS